MWKHFLFINLFQNATSKFPTWIRDKMKTLEFVLLLCWFLFPSLLDFENVWSKMRYGQNISSFSFYFGVDLLLFEKNGTENCILKYRCFIAKHTCETVWLSFLWSKIVLPWKNEDIRVRFTSLLISISKFAWLWKRVKQNEVWSKHQ